ncbi:DEAD/DEAH box helicase family protein [Pyxidicoccus sp. 3LG]
MSSPFLSIPASQWVACNALAFAIRDRFPVSPGHTLVIPRRQVATWFEATAEEQRAIFELVDVIRHGLEEELRPHGYNIGINVGEAAGQTVFHLHVHVIPRFQGDMADPRGGVRHVIPGKGNYLTGQAKPLATGGKEDPFLAHLEPLFSKAMDIAVLAAFVQDSGLEVLRESVDAALLRGARVRILTGDYLAITQADALRRLLDWTDEDTALRSEGRGRFEARVVEVEKQGVPSFHPKSWRFQGPGLAVAFVGSSNISRAALKTGIEWNLRVEKDRDPRAWNEVLEAFEVWWKRASPLTAEWVERYAQRARDAGRVLPPGDLEAEPALPRREPHALQLKALEALANSRLEGRRRALVVLATGLGKTLLAVLDVEAFERDLGRKPRVLFLAHRKELLVQAAETFRRELPSLSFGWCVGEHAQLTGDVVFASVQKLSQPEELQRLREATAFDYVIVDEVHHAAAASYRAILECLAPSFLLGLTATPERADEGDVLGLFDHHLAWRTDLGEGIQAGLLAPFVYFGLKDEVDYANIPWRNKRFLPEQLAQAVQTEARMQTLWRAWREHDASRTLVFCCSVTHAEYVRKWLDAQGVRVVAVYSGPGSADRAEALRKLTEGTLDAVCAVDLFNEGVDVPSIDRVVMLRPTESPVVFLQQLGRGLRKASGKAQVTVIDFVGNHRVFLDRVRTLLALGKNPVSLREFLLDGRTPELPPGCSVQVELEAKEMLRHFLPAEGTPIERVYRELRAARGERPTAGELYRLGYRPQTLRGPDGGWFDFVNSEKGLTPEQARALTTGKKWFAELEVTALQKCFKMVTLQALLEAKALENGMPLTELAQRSLAILQRSPELLQDLEGATALDDPRNPSARKFFAYWKDNPVDAWTKGNKWFRIEDNRLIPQLPIAPDAKESFEEMTRELVDYRLAQYRSRPRASIQLSSFDAKVISNQRDPIIKLPSRTRMPDLPHGEVEMRLPDESLWRFRFAKEYCNVARPVEAEDNQLPDLLRAWFGEEAGERSTAFHVRFTRGHDGWRVEPVRPRVISLDQARALVAFPSLRAAAGAADHALSLEDAPEADRVRLPVHARGEGLFAVRASGDSMDGGERPIRDGDWLVMRYARAAGAGALEGKVALVQVPDTAGFAYQVKRLVRTDDRWLLRSDNPARPSIEAGREVLPIALLVDVIRPEQLGPERGTLLTDAQVMERFGLSTSPKTGRYEGHLFLCVTGSEVLTKPGAKPIRIMDLRPAETAFVLTRETRKSPWHYQGVVRWLDDHWAFTESGPP